MKIAVLQINTIVGDFDGNSRKILDGIAWATAQKAGLCVFPELAVCGYPPRDLLEKPDFVNRNMAAVEAIAQKTGDTAAVVGYASPNEKPFGRALYNSAGLLHRGRVALVQHKTLLPEYDVFDEARHFEPAADHKVFEIKGTRFGLSMCEDIWSLFEYGGRRLYRTDPIEEVVREGADIVLNISASPFTLGKQALRKKLVCDEASRVGRTVIYCNLVGGNDELVFDGRSFVVDSKGRVVHEAACFEEDRFIVDTGNLGHEIQPVEYGDEEDVRRALVLGLTDYMRKCGFERAVIGISGGIDSAVVAALACDAIGPDRVTGVMMPSPYSSKESVSDSEKLMKNLGMSSSLIPIDEIYESFRRSMGFGTTPEGISVAEENLQARIRGSVLMAISNREDSLVISTGNKSEISVGYCTLYGDMAGGLALISDIPKTMVYSLARHMNRGGR